MDDSQHRYAIAAIVAVLLASVAARSAALRRSGVPVNQLSASGNANQRILVMLAPLLVAYLLARAPFPQIDAWTGALNSPAPTLGLLIAAASALLIIAAQGGMGGSWRVGVPKDGGDVDRLVTGGLYRYSRNPIYLGIMGLLVGVALAAPGPLTVGAVALSFALLSAIIGKEETYLEARFGAEFEAYARRVRRWI